MPERLLSRRVRVITPLLALPMGGGMRMLLLSGRVVVSRCPG